MPSLAFDPIRRLALLLAALAPSVLLTAPGPPRAQPPVRAAEAGVPARLLIGLAPGADFADLARLHVELGARPVHDLPGSRIAIVDVRAPARALARYAAHPATRWAEPDQAVWLPGYAPDERAAPHDRPMSPRWPGSLLPRRTAMPPPATGRTDPWLPWSLLASYPDDPLFDLQWHHEKIGSAEAWDFGRAHEITIAIIDTGVECEHPDLEGVCVPGYDYHNDDPDPDDDNQHGTIEAGVAAAVTDNARGVAGLAWGARVMPLKAMGGDGRGDVSAIVRSIEHAADHGAQVINMSLGASTDSQAMQDAVAYAAAEGVLMAAAGGNSGTGPRYPAAYPEVIGVAGTRPDDSHPPFTTGPHLELAAPGWDIQTTTLTRLGSYARHHGTSEATPLVAALAALLIEQNPEWTVPQVRQRMIDTAIDLGPPGWDETFGWGRIDAARAMDPAFAPAPTEPAPPPLYLPLLQARP